MYKRQVKLFTREIPKNPQVSPVVPNLQLFNSQSVPTVLPPFTYLDLRTPGIGAVNRYVIWLEDTAEGVESVDTRAAMIWLVNTSVTGLLIGSVDATAGYRRFRGHDGVTGLYSDA